MSTRRTAQDVQRESNARFREHALDEQRADVRRAVLEACGFYGACDATAIADRVLANLGLGVVEPSPEGFSGRRSS